jgi:hypothetical protein
MVNRHSARRVFSLAPRRGEGRGEGFVNKPKPAPPRPAPTSPRPQHEKSEVGPEKGLANLWRRKKITNTASAGRGQQTKLNGKSRLKPYVGWSNHEQK